MKFEKKVKKVKSTAEMGQKSQWGSVKPDHLEFDKQAEKKKKDFINIMRKPFLRKALNFHVVISFFTDVHLHGLSEMADSELKFVLT